MNDKQASVAARCSQDCPACRCPHSGLCGINHFPRRPITPIVSLSSHAHIAYKEGGKHWWLLVYQTPFAIDWKPLSQAFPGSGACLATRHQHCLAPVLLREWGDREHKVLVTAEGLFEYEGSTFKSLTAVARQITGAH